MMLSFSKRMVSFRKVHWVFFLSLELRSSFEKKNSMDFPSGHHPFASGQHHFASGENNCKKFFAIPQYPHPYIIFWQIKTPDFIFQLLSIISHPFGFILQQTPIQNYRKSTLNPAIAWHRVPLLDADIGHPLSIQNLKCPHNHVTSDVSPISKYAGTLISSWRLNCISSKPAWVFFPQKMGHFQMMWHVLQ